MSSWYGFSTVNWEGEREAMGSLDGMVAIVTGSSQGIGAGIARRFAAEGASVVVNARSAGGGQEAADSLPSALFVRGDISDPEFPALLVQRTLDAFGRLDVVVNNAGYTEAAWEDDLRTQTRSVWNNILGVNLLGPWQLIVEAIPALEKSGAGSVINISSVCGIRPSGPSIPYAVSKAAVDHMTRFLAVRLGPQQIRVNAVAPGFIDTEWNKDLTNPRRKAIRDQVVASAPLRRTGVPDDIAATVLGLVLSPYTTGQVVAVDGGMIL
jgi:ketoreductase RED2